jgi:hypothetical protein
MKITKSDFIALINEAIDELNLRPTTSIVTEEDVDKWQEQINKLKKDKQVYRIKIAKIDLDIKKLELDRSINAREDSEETLDNLEAKGQDVSQQTDVVNSNKEKEAEARVAVSAANNALKAAQQGGGSN